MLRVKLPEEIDLSLVLSNTPKTGFVVSSEANMKSIKHTLTRPLSLMLMVISETSYSGSYKHVFSILYFSPLKRK